MSQPRQYRLPYGKQTTSVRRYLREWRWIAVRLERATGARMIGFDPGFLMSNDGNANPVDVPVWLALRIIALYDKASAETTSNA